MKNTIISIIKSILKGTITIAENRAYGNIIYYNNNKELIVRVENIGNTAMYITEITVESKKQNNSSNIKEHSSDKPSIEEYFGSFDFVGYISVNTENRYVEAKKT